MIRKEYFPFISVNLVMVWGYIYLITQLNDGLNDKGGLALFWKMLATSFIIILLQYNVIKSANNWLKKTAWFYLSMVLFLAIVGLLISWHQAVGGNPAESWSARLDGTLRVAIFGQFWGLPFLPVVVFINWLLRKKLFT